MTTVHDTVPKVLALLRRSRAVPEHVSKRYRAVWVPERVETHEAWETSRASQIRHYETRVELDAFMRSDGIRPTMVGFEAMLSGLSGSEATSIELHLLSTQEATFLVCTNIGTTHLIGMLWSFEDGIDPFP